MTSEEANLLLEKNGKNEIVSEKPKNVFLVFLSQFNDVLIIILIICSILSFCFKDLSSGIIIVIVLLLNSIIGTVQYMVSVKQVNAIKEYTRTKILTLRDLEYKEIDSINLVLGDVIKLKKGDVIPCDAIVIEYKNLSCDESSITGEGEPILKKNDDVLYGGTVILSGEVVAKCIKMGMDSKIGEIQKMLNKTKNRKTPLEIKLDKLSFFLAFFILLISSLIYLYNIYNGVNIIDALMFSISLSVAAIPEAMSCVILIILACKTLETARLNIIIKNLKIVETLGNVNLICMDKTGTLTRNNLEVKKTFILDDRIFNKFLNLDLDDSPINSAIKRLSNGKKIKVDDYVLFDSNRKIETVLSCNYLFVKGAIEKILPISDSIIVNGEVHNINKYKALIDNHLNKMLDEGLRVIALAYKISERIDENNLIFLGLIGLSDSIKEESKDVIETLKKAGIKPVMITGDHKKTALEVSKKVGIGSKGCKSFSRDADFYYRVTPKDKIDMVKKYQELGYIVAMVGDGVNDAPALKRADVGISMGSGVNVSNEASDMVIVDDDLNKIVKALENGRGIFLNIRQAIRFLIAGNLASILCVLYTIFLNLPKPFYAIHLLFINLLTDSIPAISIGLEKTNVDLLKTKFNSKSIIDKNLFIRITFESILIFIAVMLSYYNGLNESALKAATMAFYTLCVGRMLHSINCIRKNKLSKLHLASVLISIIFLISLLLIKPLYKYIDIVYLDKFDLLYIMLYSLIPFISIKLLRFIKWR